MTKKKPSPQNRIWEKERRERLNKTFEDLHRLLPDHEPSSALTKVEILQQTIEFIGKLQKKIKDLLQGCNDPLKDQLHEQEKRLERLLGRNEELVELLRKAKIAVPPCKNTIPADARQQRGGEEKENGNRGKKSEAKRRRSSAAAKKQPVINQKHPVSHSGSTVGSDALALSGVNSVSVTSDAPAAVVSSSCTGGASQAAPSALALKHINGLSIGPGNGVNVTPALLSTPIMTTSVLISNNGNLMQMPLVAPPSSLLIVGSEDVRAKLNLKRRPHGGAKGRPKRGKFVIKSIDVIPGRIVDGKIPIPPLRRTTSDSGLKGSKGSRLKRKKSLDKSKQSRKAPVDATPGGKLSDGSEPNEGKRAAEHPPPSAGEVQSKDNQQPASGHAPETEAANGAEQSTASLLPTVVNSAGKEYEKANPPNHNDDSQRGHLEQIHLNHPDLSEDIFANLQVPGDSNAHGSHDDGSLSPTAAYLMNFPLVAGGGKAASNHIEAGDGDECDEGATVAELQTAKKDGPSETVLATGGGTEASGNMMLDNFSSFFNYGQMETIGAGSAPLPVASTSNEATITTVAAPSTRESGFSNYTTIYQSIDNMLEHRPVVPNRTTMGAPAKIPITTAESDYAASVAFTFTLTSGTATAPTTSQTGTMATNHFYGSACGALATNPAVKPVVDDFSSPLKPSIEFTFSLTGTTGSQARTVQSQYTNSAILATTMTTPSYDTYGYYHKTVPQTANYCPTFGVLDPLLTTEKPATSFTFCLTSSTKTEPSYTQSSLATHTSQTYETAPKLSVKPPPPQQGASECYPLKSAAPKLEKASQRSQGTGGHGHTDGHTNGMHQQTSIQSQQQTNSSNVAAASSSSSSQQPASTQTRYDVSWMAAGTHTDPTTSTSSQQSQQLPHHQSQHQQPLQPYEPAPAQIISSLELPVPPASYSASYKSDIFFAHPPGDENNLTWSSPSKLTNILNDSTSPYFPPVTLPSLNGDLALNTSLGTGTAVGASSGNFKGSATGTAKKGQQLQGGGGGVGQASEGTASSSFLSVSQLVNQPSRPSYHGNGNGNASATCQQKPLNNNYSAEALIGNNSYNPNAASLVSTGHDPARKDKLFDYGCGNVEGGFGSSSVPSSTALTFNFDTYGATPGADFNKGYNFSTPQNGYVPPYATDGAGYGGVPGGCTGSSSGTAGLPYYGKPSSQSYCYQQASVSSSSATAYSHGTQSGAATTGQDFTPYYLPTFGEKASTPKQYHGLSHGSSGGKGKKSHKPSGNTGSVVDFAFPVTSATGYGYPSLTNSTASDPIGSGMAVTSGDPTLQVEPHSYPTYHHSQQQQQQHQQQQQQHQQPDQRSQHHHHYGSATSDAPTVSHKSSPTGSYNYRQYSSASGGFGSVKSSKTTQHERNHQDQHHHSSFPPVHASNHQSHSHLNVSSCLNPPSAAGYGNHSSQSTLAYGTTASSSISGSRQSTSTQPHSSHHHHQPHGHASSNTVAPPVGLLGATNIPAAPGSCGTITNFNLSTICPEINDKTGRSREDLRGAGLPPVPLSVASLMTHW